MARIALPSAQQGAPRRCAGHGTFAVDRLVGALLGIETPAVARFAGSRGAPQELAAAGLGSRTSRRGKPARVARRETTRWFGAGGPEPGWSRGS